MNAEELLEKYHNDPHNYILDDLKTEDDIVRNCLTPISKLKEIFEEMINSVQQKTNAEVIDPIDHASDEISYTQSEADRIMARNRELVAAMNN